MDDEDGFLIPAIPVLEGGGMEHVYHRVIRPLREVLRRKGGTSKVRRSSEGYRVWFTAPEFYRPKMRQMLIKLGRAVASLATLPRDVTDAALADAMDRATKFLREGTPS